eukprot:TRINITY_DN10959_c0_g2_i3.p1 TRINITY_DN10959_c0_g2~~TRINITY_DN10959_c0_g2_i3.p1  ORF type:complete len:589 (+),score=81.91 TRINITY_DN10959_c0_g2_i3:135-1901(+)
MEMTEDEAASLTYDVPGFVDALTKEHAKTLLSSEINGTYLLRYSFRARGLVLSINHNGRVRHFPVLREGRNFTIDGRTKEHSVANLLRSLSNSGFKDSKGLRVAVRKPPVATVDQHLEAQSYYVPDIQREESEELLSALPIGTFLIRVNRHANLTISTHAKRKVTHIPIEVERGFYYVGSVPSQATVQDLLSVLCNEYRYVDTNRHGKVEVHTPITEDQAGNMSVRSTQKRRAHRTNNAFKPPPRIVSMEIDDTPKMYDMTFETGPACFGCSVGVEFSIMISVVLHYLGMLATVLLALYFHQEERMIAFNATIGFAAFRVFTFAIVDVTLEHERVSWLSLLDLRALQLVLYYVGDSYSREDQVTTLMHLLRVWQHIFEGFPLLVLATYAMLGRHFNDEGLDVYLTIAFAMFMVVCCVNTVGTFFRDYITVESAIKNSIAFLLYGTGSVLSRALCIATMLYLTPFYILPCFGGGLLILHFVTIIVYTPRVAMEAYLSSNAMLTFRTIFAWLGPWPTARLHEERIRHGIVSMATIVAMASIILTEPRLVLDQESETWYVVLGVLTSALLMQLVGWLLFLRLPGDDDCTII